jgi:hypothetical protein
VLARLDAGPAPWWHGPAAPEPRLAGAVFATLAIAAGLGGYALAPGLLGGGDLLGFATGGLDPLDLVGLPVAGGRG